MAWRGVFAIGILIILTVWLGYEGMLGFYIHPRYNVFTLVMAGIGLLLIGIAVVIRPRVHSHSSHQKAPHSTLTEWLSFGLIGTLIVIATVLPPTTLSSYTAENRSLGTVTLAPVSDVVATDSALAGFENLTVRDWASLLIQTQDPAFFRGKPFSALGTISPSDDPDVFLLTRFVVTCCAVDAQPVNVPVYYPEWESEFPVDSWVRVRGGFQVIPGLQQPGNLAVITSEILREEVPRDPYLF